jgi:hypothetical protein
MSETNICLEFTDPKHIQEDLTWMRVMLAHAFAQARAGQAPGTWHSIEEDQRGHRLVLNRPELLTQAETLHVVGFFSQVSHNDPELTVAVHRADEELIEEFANCPGLYSYSSLELPGGQWGNLATFRDEEARDAWANNEKHLRAVRDFAAKHYRNIRLHNARLTGQTELELLRTKFFAYTDNLTWRAVRCCDPQQR